MEKKKAHVVNELSRPWEDHDLPFESKSQSDYGVIMGSRQGENEGEQKTQIMHQWNKDDIAFVSENLWDLVTIMSARLKVGLLLD